MNQLRIHCEATWPAAASNGFFGHSPGRIAHEKVWTRALYEKLTELLWRLPVNWRFYVKHQLMNAIGALDLEDVSPAELESAFDGLLETTTRSFRQGLRPDENSCFSPSLSGRG